MEKIKESSGVYKVDGRKSFASFAWAKLTKLMRAVIEYTQCRVKTKSKLTNLKINSRIEGYNGK